MAISVKIKDNSKQVRNKFKKLGSALPRIIDKALKQAGFQLIDIIRTKTKKGIDFNNKRFAPYSDSYLKRLQSEGRPTAVDLIYDNKMMGALTPSMVKKTGKHKISIAFSRKEEIDKAFFNQVLNEPKREFFGFNKRTEDIISKQFNRFVSKELRKMKI
jgi:hypothetical protein